MCNLLCVDLLDSAIIAIAHRTDKKQTVTYYTMIR